MKIEGELILSASADKIWEMLQDPAFLAEILPGCKELKPSGKDQFKGILEAKVGPISSQYTTQFSIHDKNPPHSYLLKIAGNGKGGFVRADTFVSLHPQKTTTIFKYHGEATIGGTIARVGQRLVDAAAKMLINKGFKSLQEKVEERMKE
ncbi:MAG: CoxG family protein [bacterium]